MNAVTQVMPHTLINAHQLTVLKFTGGDAAHFLQGQLSNDINNLNDHWYFSGYCNPKGRLLALLTLWKDNEDIYALVPSSIVAAIVKRLRMYVMRSNVVIDIIDNVAISNNFESNLPRFTYSAIDSKHRLSFGGRDLVVDLEPSQANNCVSNQWTCQNIADGLPEITNKTMELFVPQMVNLDLLGGINFKKGCYTGQEIVARMHYLGKLKQRMFVCTISIDQNENGDTSYADNDACQAGDKVSSGDKAIGHIVSVAGDQVLAVLRVEALSNNATDLAIESLMGKKIRLSINNTQPYSIELKT